MRCSRNNNINKLTTEATHSEMPASILQPPKAYAKPRSPTANAKRKDLYTRSTSEPADPPLHTSRSRARFAQSSGRSICSVWPGLPMSCVAVSM